MNISVTLAKKWRTPRTYGSFLVIRHDAPYQREDPDIAYIPKYKVRIERREDLAFVAFENEDKGEWHQGGHLLIPMSVARRLGAVLVGWRGGKKGWLGKGKVLRVQEGDRVRIRG